MRKAVIIVSLTLLSFALISGVLTVQAEEAELAEFEQTFIIAEESWPGIATKNEVVRQLLTAIGYDLETSFLSNTMAYHGFEDGDVDLWLGSWMPEETPLREGHEGSFEVVGTNLEEAYYISAVPEFVYEEGIRSHSDLAEHAEKFDYKIHAGPPGSGADEVISSAVEEDIYNLGDWEVVNADWPATVAAAEAAVEDGEWIVFPGWQPHWMNVLLDLKYLEDPEGIWGDAESEIQSLARTNLREEAPNLITFLENFSVESDHQSRWVYEYDREGREEADIARDWIGENMDVVADWLEGVVAADGSPALEAVEEEF